MVWQQVYDPFNNPVLSTLMAAVPVVVMLASLAFFHVKAHLAALLALTSALLIAIFAFIGAAMRRKGAITLFEGLVVLSALGGVAAAGHHVYTQFFPQVSCGIDVLQPIVDDLPLAKVFPLGFQVDGFCSTPYPPVLGLSLAQWALVAFVLTVILVPLGIYRNRQRQA